MIKFGIVGMGIRGNLFARLLAQNPDAELVAFSEPDPTKLETASKTYRAKAYKDYCEMLERETLDAVIITTPDFAHKDPVIKSLEKGLHVLVEKPLAQKVEEAEEMLEKDLSAGTKCMVAFENRWNPSVLKAKEEIDGGKIGHILALNGSLSDTLFVPLNMISWSARTTCGWFLLSHLLDLAYFLSGKRATSVYASGTKRFLKELGVDTYDYIHVIVKYEDGSSGLFESAWCLPKAFPNIYDFRFSVYGEKGLLRIDLSYQMVETVTEEKYLWPQSLSVECNAKLICYPGFMLEKFIEIIKHDEVPQPSFEDGLQNTRLLDAIHRSLVSSKEEKL